MVHSWTYNRVHLNIVFLSLILNLFSYIYIHLAHINTFTNNCLYCSLGIANNKRQKPGGKTVCTKRRHTLRTPPHNPTTLCSLQSTLLLLPVKKNNFTLNTDTWYSYIMFSRKNPLLSITAPPSSNTTWCIPSSSLLHTSTALWISFSQFARSVDAVLPFLQQCYSPTTHQIMVLPIHQWLIFFLQFFVDQRKNEDLNNPLDSAV